MASNANLISADTTVGNYYLCQDGKYRQLPANAFKDTTYSVAKYNSIGLLKPAYTSTNAATLTDVAATNTSTPTINSRSTTSGKYYAIEADKNGIAFVNVP